MAEFDHLQSILGTDRKNAIFSVFQHSETGQYHVYYGAELFEVVPSDREDARFKLMVAHLCNIGVGLSKLQRTFQVDPRTIKGWSNALRSGDAEQLSRALAGRSAGRKLTPAVEHYVRIRFPSVYALNRSAYSSKIRRELKDHLGVELSAETLRPLFGQLKAELDQGGEEEGGEEDCKEQGGGEVEDREGRQADEPDDRTPPGDGGSSGQERGGSSDGNSDSSDSGAEGGDGASRSVAGSNRSGGEPCQAVAGSAKPLRALSGEERSVPNNRRRFAEIEEARWCSHLGLLLFSFPLSALRRALGRSVGQVVCQWAGQVLMGAANLEQSKLISGRDLGLLLGGGLLGSPDHQRKALAELAKDPALADEILRWNFQRVGGEQMSDFYFDPHTKHYTGEQNLLKGWCPKIRWADKVLHGDFVHSTSGQPLYLENVDNYEDMRRRFQQLEGRFRVCLCIDPQRVLTWIIDRGIFGSELFEWILASPYLHLITWEKGYQRGAWPEAAPPQGAMTVERCRNHSADKKLYHFEWIEEPWPKNPKLRRLLVRATNAQGNQIEVSILTDDWDRPAQETVWLIFDRWVQENDFKYLDEHFGINEITSYRSETYAEIRHQLEDREMKNAERTALETARREQQQRLGKLLVLNRDSLRKERDRSARIDQLAAKADSNPEQRRELGRLKGAQRSARRHQDQRTQKIETIQQEIDRLDNQLAQTDKTVSRLDTLIAKDAVRLCGERKYLMDVIKITARNIFYEIFEPFKRAYDNFRDDHVWFRHLSRSGGVIVPDEEAQSLRCHLIGTADFTKPLRRIIAKVLANHNESQPRLPDGSDRPIELVLGSKSTIQLAKANPASRGEN